MDTWIADAINNIKSRKVSHVRYTRIVTRIFNGLFAADFGEVIILVGPSRVGKSRCIRDALSLISPLDADSGCKRRVVIVEAENASKNGEFSTKAFMFECLKAVEHPIYGVARFDDYGGERLRTLIHKTAESTLREAFERALLSLQIEVLAIDEAHHVAHAPGGPQAAIRILDSYKSLANKTRVKLLLAGAYDLLGLIRLSPHLVGRGEVITFDRYAADDREDVIAWTQVLKTYSKELRFKDERDSLCKWGEYIHEGAFGCVGHLSRWLRRSLSYLATASGDHLTLDALQATRVSEEDARAIASDISHGEQAAQAWNGVFPKSSTSTGGKPKYNSRPFTRNSRRSPPGCRA